MQCITIPLTPVAWQRPRTHGNRYYDPQVKIKDTFRLHLPMALGSVCGAAEPLSVVGVYQMPMPKSWSRRRRLQAFGKPHAQWPDIDNLFKFIFDAFNGYLWKDDRYISSIYGRKVWSDHGKVILHYGPESEFLLSDFFQRGESLPEIPNHPGGTHGC